MVLIAATGCADRVPTYAETGVADSGADDEGESDEADDAAPTSGTSSAAESSGDDDGDTTADTAATVTTFDESSGNADDFTGGCGFLCDPDGGGVNIECDVWAQDCSEGQKCMPWANDGGSSWNATKCSPLDPNPAQPGDACAVEGSGVSGIDDCDVSSMCWDVDPETNMGTCIAFCSGSEANPVCEDPSTTCAIANEGVLILCLPNCDPLLQDCIEGQACYPIDDDFACAPDASAEMGVFGNACEFINACDPGLFCANPDAVPNCAGGGCCSTFCDLSDPDGSAACPGAAGGQECVAWYEEGQVPPGYENVGACAIPA
jgi:hypothetical protein